MEETHLSIPVELTDFVPEEYLPTMMPTWRFEPDPFRETVEIKNRVFSKNLVALLVGMFVFCSVLVGIICYFVSRHPINPLGGAIYLLIPLCTYTAMSVMGGIFIAVSMQNAALWKNKCRFRFDKNSGELFFSREDKRYAADDYDEVTVGVTHGYNIRDLPQYRKPDTGSSPPKFRFSSRSDSIEPPMRVTQLYLLVHGSDGNWTRHLVVYDQNTKAIQRAALQLQEMLQCRLVTREMSVRECAAMQLPGIAVKLEKDRLKSRLKVVYVFTGIFTIVAFSIIAFGLYNIYYGNESLSWPTCTGTVVASEVITHPGDSGGGKHSSPSPPSYTPEITYSYTVSGQQHTSRRYAYGNWSFSKYSEAQKIVNDYPPHSEVTVYYSPDNPKTSVLVPGVQSAAYGFCIFGGVFFLFTSVIFLIFWRSLRPLDFSAPREHSEPVITPPPLD
ncbi:MAG: DUF3592 domain-containing protein [Planctomycetaceae bacterium]|nr:DUF3592 domain-containing protein [Planctomycetaceae bacterium]